MKKLMTLSLLITSFASFGNSYDFEAQSNEAVISASINYPANKDTSTALILVGGSGVKLRQETAKMNALFHSFNVAVVNYDRRGNGLSTGFYQRPNTANSAQQIPLFAQDIAAVAVAVKADSRFNIDKVIVAGSSMGAWIAPLAATKTTAIDGVINIVGGATSVKESDFYDHITDLNVPMDQAQQLISNLSKDNSYQPQLALETVQQPILWLYGEMDDSHPTAVDVMRLLTIQTKFNKDFTIKVYGQTNHQMVNQTTGEMDKGWMKDIPAWLNNLN